jgi:hypothetical protein
MFSFLKKFIFTLDYDYIDDIRSKVASIGYKILKSIYDYLDCTPFINYIHLHSLYDQIKLMLREHRRYLYYDKEKELLYLITKTNFGLFVDLLIYIRDTYNLFVSLGFHECFWIGFLVVYYIIVRSISNQYHAPDLGKLKTQNYGGNPAPLDKFYERYSRFDIFNLYNIKDIAHEVRFFYRYDFNHRTREFTCIKVDWSPYFEFGAHAMQYSWILLRDGTSHYVYNHYNRRRYLLEDTPVIIRDSFLYIYHFIYEGFVQERISTIITLIFFSLLIICKVINYILNVLNNIINKINGFFLSLKKIESIINKLDIYREKKYKYINKYNNLIEKLKMNFYISKIIIIFNYIIYYCSYIDKYIVDPFIDILIYIYIFTEIYIKYAKECWNFWYNIYSYGNIICNYITYYTIYLPFWSTYEYISTKDEDFIEKHGWSPLYYLEVTCLAIISYYYGLTLYFVETTLEFTEDFVPWWEKVHDNETLKYYLNDDRSLYMIPIFYIFFTLCLILNILLI